MRSSLNLLQLGYMERDLKSNELKVKKIRYQN